jgi:hypothetical protein
MNKSGIYFKYGILGMALLVSILATILPPEHLQVLSMVSRFFEIMIPFLAVGALIKYLCCCGDKKNHCNH